MSSNSWPRCLIFFLSIFIYLAIPGHAVQSQPWQLKKYIKKKEKYFWVIVLFIDQKNGQELFDYFLYLCLYDTIKDKKTTLEFR